MKMSVLLTEEKNEWKNRFLTMQKQFESLQEEHVKASTKLQSLEEERQLFSSFVEENKRLRELISNLNHKNQELLEHSATSPLISTIEHQNEVARMQRLEAQLEAVVAELESTRVQLKLMQSENQNLQKTLETPRNDSGIAPSPNVQLIDAYVNTDEPLKAPDDLIKERLDRKLEEYQALQNENKEISEQLSELRVKIIKMVEENGDLAMQLDNEKQMKSKVVNELQSLLVLKEEMDNLKAIIRSGETNSDLKQEGDEDEMLRQEKAKLEFQVERLTHLNEQLQMEAETIPLYIEKYHEERKLLKRKTAEKDKVIELMMKNYNDLLLQFEGIKKRLEESDARDMVNAVELAKTMIYEAQEELQAISQITSPIDDFSGRFVVTGMPVHKYPPCPSCASEQIDI